MKQGLAYLKPRSMKGSQTLVHLGDPLRSLPLLGQCPAPQHGSPREHVRKLMVACEGDRRFCLRLGRPCIAAEAMQPTSKV